MEKIEKIKRLLTNEFELNLFEASLASLSDGNNKLRFNNFAYSIRELSRHFLYNLAPEENVKDCVWFISETENAKPTRNQRIKYAIQGGIDNELLKKWGVDINEINEVINDVKDTINTLSKYTHINPEVFDINLAEVEKRSQEVLESFIGLVETIENYREFLKSFLDGHIEEHMVLSVVTNSFENIDNLAPHYSLEDSEIVLYHVSEINPHEIVVDVSGNVYVTLEYGSRQERREGDGLDIRQSFPFETKIRYQIDEDFPLNSYEVDDYGVDTSSWYDEDER
jgi:hypothetical protein